MTQTRRKYSAFIPHQGDPQGTAQVLVQTARENEIDQRSIQAAQGGFNVTEELADVLYEVDYSGDDLDDLDDDPDAADPDPVDPDAESDKSDEGGKTTKTSGNRAEKNKNSKE